MIKQTPQKRELFANALKRVPFRVFAVILVSVTVLLITSVAGPLHGLLDQTPFSPRLASAATASNLNFQARLQNAAGAIAPDGSYNIEFKLYNVSSGGSALWTEDYLNNAGQGVVVKNGYVTVNLGSITAFPGTINWDQDIWLTMTVRGTGSCAFGSCTPADAEMSPRLKLTASAYAFRAGQLAQFNSGTGFTSTLSIVQPTGGNQTFQIADQGAAGTYTLLTQNTANLNYIQNQNAGAQSSSVFWISGTGRADTSMLTPLVDATAASGTLAVGGANATTVNIGTTTAATAISLGGNGVNVIAIGNNQTGGSISLGAAMTTGTINIGGTGAQTGNIDIGVGTGAQSINLGTGGTAAKTVTIGSTNSTSSTTIRSGTGGIAITSQTTGAVSIDSGTIGAINIGTGSNSKVITLGNNIGTTSTAINSGTGGISLNTTFAGAISISSGSTGVVSLDSGTTGAVNIGTGSFAKTVTLGSSTSTASTLIQSGSGDLTLNSGITGNVVLQGEAILANGVGIGTYDNFIDNPGFETGNENQGWATNPSYTIESSDVRNGNYALTTTSTGANFYKLHATDIPIKAGDTFYGEVWIKSIGAAGNGGLRFAWLQKNKTASAITANDFPGATNTVSNTWTKVAGSATAPADAAYLRVYIRTSNTTTGVVHEFDDAYVTKEMTLPQLSINGSLVLTSAGVLQNVTTDASILTSGTITSARLAGGYTGITAVGTLTSLTTSGVITSTVSTGTAPLIVASTTKVTNLNADLLDGIDSTGFAAVTGGTGYIQNQNAGAQSASNFWVSGTGRADTSLITPLLDTATAVALNIGTSASGINLNQNVTVASGKTLTVTSGTTTLGGDLAFNGTNITSTSATINLFNGATPSTVNLSTSANATAVNIGNVTGASALNLKVGTGNFTLDGATTSTYTIGTSTTTGTVTIGGTAQTGAITLGSSTGTNTINIANGSGAGTVNIANVQNAGAVNIGATMTTGTITIGGTGLQTGTIGIGVGTGAQNINLGTGSGAKGIAIGGSGANAITIGDTQTGGSISLGATMTTGTINIGGTGLQTGSIGIGTGTGAQTINLGTGGTGVKTINLGGSAANVINIGNTQSTGSINIGNGLTVGGSITIGAGTGSVSIGGTGSGAKVVQLGSDSGASQTQIWGGTAGILLDSGTTGAISIGNTGAATGTISLGTGTGAQNINIGTGGTGAKAITIGGSAPNVIALGDNQAGGSISIGSVMTTGFISIGGTGAQTGAISIGAGTGAQVVSLGTGGTGAKTVTVGSVASTGTTSLRSGTGGISLLTATSGNISIATGSTGTVTIGSGTTGTVTVDSGSTGAVNIGTGAFSKVVTLGSATGTSSTVIQSGSGDITINGGTTGNVFIQGEGIYANGAGVGTYDNYLDNPGFETGSASQGWITNVNYTVQSADVHNGNYAVNSTSTGANFYFQNGVDIPIKAGDTFYGEVWLKSVAAAGEGGLRFNWLTKTKANSTVPNTYPGFTATVADTWTKVSGVATAPSDAAYLRVFFRTGSNSTGVVHEWDDAYVTKETNLPQLSIAGSLVLTSGRVLQNVTTDASIITTGTLNTARVSGSYTGITAVGTLTSLTTSGVITSSVTTGTAPLTIASTTKVTNLNADLLDGIDSTGFATATGGTGYIQNQNAGAQSSSNFWVSGTGRADTSLLTPTLDTATAVALGIGTSNATVINLNQNTAVTGSKTLTVGTGAVSFGGTLGVTGAATFSSTTTSTGLLTASNGFTLTTGALNVTASSGALAISGLGASSISTGANGFTITSSNFNTTATGINGTAIGATTASTGAFTTVTLSGALTSIVSTGTAPLVVASTTKVTNLNADLLDGLDSTNFAAASGSTSYIQNQNASAQTTSNLWISGTARADTALIAPAIRPTTDSTTAFQIQNAGGTSTVVNVNTSGNGVALLANNSGELQPWQTNANALPNARHSPGTVTANGYIYVIGGTVAQTQVWYAKANANGSTGAWQTNPNTLPGGRDKFTAMYANGYIYVIGGNDGTNTQTQVYYAKVNSDGTTGVWATSANSLPVARERYGGATSNGYLYVTGGFDGTNNRNTILYSKVNADGSIGAWQCQGISGNCGVTPANGNVLPAQRYAPTVVTANGFLYVMGGSSAGAQAQVYYAPINADGSTGAFTTNANSLPAGREVATSVVANGYVYVLAGKDAVPAYTTTVYYAKFNTDGSIGAFTTGANSIPAGRDAAGSVILNGYVYVIGGFDGTSTFGTVYYASVPRVQVGGALDLLGLQGQTVADYGSLGANGSVGGELTAGNTSVVGTLQVMGMSAFSQNVLVNKDLTVAGNSSFQGDVVIKNASATGFSVTNASAIQFIGVNTSASTVTIGNTTGATGVIVSVGTGNFGLDGVAGSTYAIGASTTTGTITIGGTAQTGAITIGSSTGTNTVNIANGSGAGTVNIANVQNGGAVNIGAGMTTGTISIGGTAQTGALNIGTGTGIQTLNFGTGGTGAKTVTLGSTASTGATLIQSGTNGLTLRSATSGTVTLDSGSTGDVNLGTGAGGKFINIGGGGGNVINIGVGTSAENVTIGGSGASIISVGNTQTGGAVNIGATMTTGTITIGGTGLQTGTIGIGVGTGAQNINLGTGSGAKGIAIGGSGANAITIGNTQTGGSISLGATMTTGTITIGGTGAQTGTIGIGTGTGAQTINVGTGGTGAKTVTLGSTVGTTTIQAGSGIALNGNTSLTGTLSVTGPVNTLTTAASASVTFDNAATSTQNVLALNVAGTNRAKIRTDSIGNLVLAGTGGGATYLNYGGGTGGTIIGNSGSAAVATFSDTGQALFQNSTNSASAFGVQSSEGNTVLNIDNSLDSDNLITNPGFEVNTTGWSAKAGTTISRSTAQEYFGQASLSAVTTAVANTGVKYPITLTASTDYDINVDLYSASAVSTIQIGFSSDGSTEATYVATVSLTGGKWERKNVHFTAPASFSGSPYIFIKQSDATARTFYVDAAQVINTTIWSGVNKSYSESRISIGGAGSSATSLGINTVNPNAALEVDQRLGQMGFLLKGNGDNYVFSPPLFRIQNGAGVDRITYSESSDSTVIQGGNSFYNSAALSVQTLDAGATAMRVRGAASQSVDIFQVQDSAGGAYLAVGSGGIVTVGTATNKVTLSVNGIVLSGTARNAKTIFLGAEYPSAVLDPGTLSNNVGTMISAIDLTNRMNYYKWTTASGTNQSYDIDVQVAIPKDFSAWDANPLAITGYTSNTTNGTILVEARDSAGSVICNFVSVTPGSTGTWATNNTACTLSTGTYTAGDYITLRVRLQSPTSGDVRVGNIKLNYLSNK